MTTALSTVSVGRRVRDSAKPLRRYTGNRRVHRTTECLEPGGVTLPLGCPGDRGVDQRRYVSPGIVVG